MPSTLKAPGRPGLQTPREAGEAVASISNEPQGALKIRTPNESAPTAQFPGFFQPAQPVRAYRAAQEDRHFRHPLGGFP